MEMKRNLLLLIGLCMAVCVQAQKKNFSYKFYGQVRGDLFYNCYVNLFLLLCGKLSAVKRETIASATKIAQFHLTHSNNPMRVI